MPFEQFKMLMASIPNESLDDDEEKLETVEASKMHG